MGNVPKLRFPGFEGEWKKELISNIGDINPRNGILPEQFLYIDLESVVAGQLKRVNIIKKQEAPSRAQRILIKNDILFQAVRPYQQNNYFFNGNTKPVVASTGYLQMRVNENPLFIYQLIHTSRFLQKVLVRCTGTSYPAINNSDFKTIRINYPSPPEQTKIANFLILFDKKTEKQAEKVAALEEYKKGLLQKIFTCEIRFKDDDGNDYPEWENKFFGDIFCFHPTYSYSRALLNDTGSIKYIHYGDIHTKYPIVLDVKNAQIPCLNSATLSKAIDSYSYCREGDLIIADASEDYEAIGKATVLINIGNDKIISGLHTILARGEQNHITNSFRGYLFASEGVKKQIRFSAVGAKVLGISKTNLAKIKITLPTVPEQTKIANFLTLFDRKVEKEKGKLRALREQKQGLLQQMFV